MDRIQISVTSAREHDLAKEALARGQPGKARTALRRRKYHDSLLAKTDTQLETLEQLVRIGLSLPLFFSFRLKANRQYARITDFVRG